MENKDLKAIGGDLSPIYDKETIKALHTTKDLIGAILRIHFCLEGFLNLWCSKIAQCEDFFDFSNSTTFYIKLEISKKLGLPHELSVVFKKFNQMRNKFAHEANHIVSNDDLNSIRYAIDQIPVNISPTILKVEDSFIVQADQPRVGWNTPNASTLHKLLLLFTSFHLKIIMIFAEEFTKKGISFSFQETKE